MVKPDLPNKTTRQRAAAEVDDTAREANKERKMTKKSEDPHAKVRIHVLDSPMDSYPVFADGQEIARVHPGEQEVENRVLWALQNASGVVVRNLDEDGDPANPPEDVITKEANTIAPAAAPTNEVSNPVVNPEEINAAEDDVADDKSTSKGSASKKGSSK